MSNSTFGSLSQAFINGFKTTTVAMALVASVMFTTASSFLGVKSIDVVTYSSALLIAIIAGIFLANTEFVKRLISWPMVAVAMAVLLMPATGVVLFGAGFFKVSVLANYTMLVMVVWFDGKAIWLSGKKLAAG